MDLRTREGQKDTGISIFPVREDPEQVLVSVSKDVTAFVRGERKDVIFPGGSGILNRDGFEVFEGSTGKIIARVIHSEKPIK